MLTINTNLSSLIAQGSMKSSTNKLNQAIERMTTGFKINHAKDNAANYSISTNMTTKIGAYNVAEDNAAMGLDLISTAEGTLDQIEDKLQRLRALAEQAANGTYGEQSLNAINAEANALVDEINRLYSTAEYNGIKLFEQETQIPDDPNIPKAQYDGFIKEVVRRDTSMMTTLASVDGAVDLADGTYSISTPEEMKKLADMTNAGLVSAGDEFVLANDIDLSQYENWEMIGGVEWNSRFMSSFDGNGYVIKNITQIASSNSSTGLFGYVVGGNIKNLGLENVHMTSSGWSGTIAVRLYRATLENCYVKGGTVCATSEHNKYAQAGGLVSDHNGFAIIDSCYVDNLEIYGSFVGGIASFSGGESVQLLNSFSNAKLFGDEVIGGLYAFTGNHSSNSIYISNCLSNGVTNIKDVKVGSFLGLIRSNVRIENSYYSSKWEKFNINLYNQNTGTFAATNLVKIDEIPKSTVIQVGINSIFENQIILTAASDLADFQVFRRMGTNNINYLAQADCILNILNTKQIEYGVAYNRLESALEEITIQRDNLVSSRSTIRDADIAEVSSHYIQQQILQQASATLLATANQSPAIALQLI